MSSPGIPVGGPPGGPPGQPPLDSAPPAPPPPGGLVSPGGLPGMPSPQDRMQEEAKQVTNVGSEIDMALKALSQVVGPGAAEIGQARQLIKTGIAKYLAQAGTAGSAPPTATGETFPGGGFSSIR